MLKPQEEVTMAARPDLTDRARDSVCFQSLLGFFFNKGVRGGPRVLLYLASLLVGLFVFVKLLPQSMTEGALQSIPQSIWSSQSSEGGKGSDGGLRIVVFGEIDIGTPVGANEEVQGSKSWTQALCDEASCCVPFKCPKGCPAELFLIKDSHLARLRLPYFHGTLSGCRGVVRQLQ